MTEAAVNTAEMLRRLNAFRTAQQRPAALIGFDGYIRPDHGRMIWDEQARPGYGLYDRALGIAYLNGLWEALEKNDK